MERPAENGLIQVYFPIPDLNVVATIRISAYPRFVLDCCSLTAEVREGN